MDPRRLKFPLPVAFALLCASCGGDGAEAPPELVPVRRLDFAPTVPRPTPNEGLSVERFEPPPDLDPWMVAGEGVELVERADGGRELLLQGAGPFSIRIPTHILSRRFRRIAVAIESTRGASIEARFVNRKREIPSSPRISVHGMDGVQVVFIDVPWTRFFDEWIDLLVLRIRSEGGRDVLHAVELLERPLVDWLPRSESGGDLVALGVESRRVVGLSTGEILRARFVPDEGDRLEFASGVPHFLSSMSKPSPVLHIRLRSEGMRDQLFAHAVGGFGAEPRWHPHSLELDEYTGREVELEISLDAGGPIEEALAIERPRLRRPESPAPTVLLVSSDTHRGDHTGYARQGVDIRTPNLDALAASGVVFTDCFSTANVTTPSHVALLTGRHPRDHGVLDNQTRLSDAATTLAEVFREAGYFTIAAVSHAQLGHARGGFGQGFDIMFAPEVRFGDAADAVDAIESRLPDLNGLPLFCWMHVFDAHEPYMPPDGRFVELYYPVGKDPFDVTAPRISGLSDRVLSESLSGLRDLEYPRACYRAEITYLDEQLGRLLDRPRFRAGIIGITADHGESLGMHGIYFSHADLYPDSLHVPLMLHFPGASAGARFEHPVRQYDLGRTLLDLAGLQALEFPGSDLLREEGEELPSDAPRFALAANAFTASITREGWHLILQLRENGSPHMVGMNHRHELRLFDLRADPDCLDDVLARGAHFDRARALRAQLGAWLLAARDLGWSGARDTRPEVLSDLEGLGYVTAAGGASTEELFDPDCDCDACLRIAE